MIRYLLASAVTLALAAGARAESPAAQVARQFRQFALASTANGADHLLDDAELPRIGPGQAADLLRTLAADGSWPDIDYASRAASSWPPRDHVSRLLALTVFARNAATAPADATAALAAVHRGLAYWQSRDLQCPNWWYNQIGVPKILGNTALLLNADLTPAEREYVANTVLARAKVGAMTGQNRVWLAANGIMRAALLDDDKGLEKAAGVIRDEIQVSTSEGIQPDFSFHQHGPQQQFGNYGMAFAVEISRWANVLRGTPAAFPPAKIDILRNYLLQGQDWVTWRGVMDISACGRQLFPGSPQHKAGVIGAVMRVMADTDPTRAADYLAFLKRNFQTPDAPNDLTGARFFWRSDYLIDRQPAFMASLKMSSDRVVGGETVNDENLSGRRLADGATYFYRTGNEYQDIFPVWDWRKIPGTTSLQDNASLEWPKPDLAAAPAFVGGVSDGHDACAVMDFHRAGVSAHKAWFFHEDTILCLGAAIHSDSPDPLVTTLNQCLLTGPITVDREGAAAPETLAAASATLTHFQWLEHAGFRYTPLQPDACQLTAGPRTGNWKTVFRSPATPAANVTKNVFTLAIDHGPRAADASYAYAVTPANTAAAAILLANTPAVQCVRFADGSLVAALWSAGSATLDHLAIESDAPCLLLISHTAGAAHTYVSDPTQKLRTLTIRIGDTSKTIDLPQGSDAGKTLPVPELDTAATKEFP